MRRLVGLLLAAALLVPAPAAAAPVIVVGTSWTVDDGVGYQGATEVEDVIRIAVVATRVRHARHGKRIYMIRIRYVGVSGQPISAPFDWSAKGRRVHVRHPLRIRILTAGQVEAGWLAWRAPAGGLLVRFVRNGHHRQLEVG